TLDCAAEQYAVPRNQSLRTKMRNPIALHLLRRIIGWCGRLSLIQLAAAARLQHIALPWHCRPDRHTGARCAGAVRREDRVDDHEAEATRSTPRHLIVPR